METLPEHPPLYRDVTLAGTLVEAEKPPKTFKFFRTQQPLPTHSLALFKKVYRWQIDNDTESFEVIDTPENSDGKGEVHILMLDDEKYVILLEDKTATFKDVLKNGAIQASFRLTQLPIPIIETLCLANIDSVKPGSLAAAGIVSIMRNFVLHAPGSFTHLINMRFIGESPEEIKKTSILFYSTQIIVTVMGAIILPLPLFSGALLSGVFGVNPVIADNVQKFFRAYAYGYFPMQWFGVNRRIFTGIQNEQKRRALLALIGALDTGVYIAFAYGLIQGVFGSILGNEGDGYAFSIAAGFSFLLSTTLLAANPTLRIYCNPGEVEFHLLRKEIAKTLFDHIPISARFYVEQLSLLWLSIWTGVISHNSLVTLQVCNTLIPFSEGPSFSFIGGCKGSMSAAWINTSEKAKKIVAQTLGVSVSYSAAFLIAASIAAKPLARLFLHSQTPENQELIANLVQVTLPIMAANEIVSTFLHGQRTILQSVGARADKKIDAEMEYESELEHTAPPPTSKILMKESAIVAGHTAVFKLGAFLPLSYAIGLKLDYGLPGMAGIYMLCMIGLLLSLLPRTISALKHPDAPPNSCLTVESFKNAARNLISFGGTTYNRWRGTRAGEGTPLLQDPRANIQENIQQRLSPPSPL